MAIDHPSTKEDLAVRYGEVCAYAALHSADPAGTGAGEITAIARQAITWNPGSVDGVITSTALTFDVPAGNSVTHVGLWDSLTAGVYKDKRAFDYQITYPDAGTLTFVLSYTQS